MPASPASAEVAIGNRSLLPPAGGRRKCDETSQSRPLEGPPPKRDDGRRRLRRPYRARRPSLWLFAAASMSKVLRLRCPRQGGERSRKESAMKVVVATDRSQTARQAVSWAADLAG